MQVKDAIALDAKLVPLYRLMAAECDTAIGMISGSPAPAPAAALPAAGVSDIADAEKVLAQHFGDASPTSTAGRKPAGAGGGMSAAEAEAILAQHFK
jgi:hypothetical protein